MDPNIVCQQQFLPTGVVPGNMGRSGDLEQQRREGIAIGGIEIGGGLPEQQRERIEMQ